MAAYARTFLKWVTGAEEKEQPRVLLTFLALLCLLVSYYLIKPLRNSKFLEEFHPSRLPLVYSMVAFLSFTITKLFSSLSRVVEKYRLVSATYLVIIACKIELGRWLLSGGKTAVIVFYFFASVYFLLAVATLWACINDMFSVVQGERLFGFIALGGTIGSLVGARAASAISRSFYKDQTLYFSVAFMMAALLFVLSAARFKDSEPVRPGENTLKESDGGFWSELKALGGQSYIRNVAFTVCLLAVATTAIEFVSQATIDKEMARRQHQVLFATFPSIDFEQVYQLKSMSPGQREQTIGKMAQLTDLSPDQMSNLYAEYKEKLENETRAFFADTYFLQSLVGIFSLLVVARFLFPRVGMRYCYIVLPILSVASLALFGFTVDLILVQLVIVLVGSVNYSLNNAAKEILYTATDEETLFRFKPMIEGPCMRAGDVISSVLKLSVSVAAATFALSEVQSTHLFVIVTILLLGFWVRAAWLAGREYDERRAQILGGTR